MNSTLSRNISLFVLFALISVSFSTYALPKDNVDYNCLSQSDNNCISVSQSKIEIKSCDDGYFCSQKYFFANITDELKGECEKKKKHNLESCEKNEDCYSGRCHADGYCQKRNNAKCNSHSQCNAVEYCNIEEGKNEGTCIKSLNPFEKCKEHYQCPYGYFCAAKSEEDEENKIKYCLRASQVDDGHYSILPILCVQKELNLTTHLCRFTKSQNDSDDKTDDIKPCETDEDCPIIVDNKQTGEESEAFGKCLKMLDGTKGCERTCNHNCRSSVLHKINTLLDNTNKETKHWSQAIGEDLEQQFYDYVFDKRVVGYYRQLLHDRGIPDCYVESMIQLFESYDLQPKVTQEYDETHNKYISNSGRYLKVLSIGLLGIILLI